MHLLVDIELDLITVAVYTLGLIRYSGWLFIIAGLAIQDPYLG